MKFYIVLGVSMALTACGAVTEPLPPETLAASANAEAHPPHASTPALLSGYVERPVKGPACVAGAKRSAISKSGGQLMGFLEKDRFELVRYIVVVCMRVT